MERIISTRREFLRQTAFGLCAGSMLGQTLAASNQAAIPTRPLGNTGVKVSILGLGGYHIGTIPEDDRSVRLIRMAIDQGVTFLDNGACCINKSFFSQVNNSGIWVRIRSSRDCSAWIKD